MFGSVVLDVAIGITIVYLLFSTICSAIVEIIESLTKNRAKDLERGIRELLSAGPGVPAGDGRADDLTRKFYRHPLIYSLFSGEFESSCKKWWWQTGVSLPSYIPARSFALALMDIALPGNTTPASGTSRSTPETPSTASAEVVVNTTASGSIMPAAPAGTPAPVQVAELRSAILWNPALNENTKKALVSLVDAAGHDIAQVRQNIENWFNSAMDRVSGWYKRRTQLILVSLGLLLSILINVDTVAIARGLSTDKSLRDSVVATAQEYAKQTGAPPAQTGCDADCRLEKAETKLQALGLPIGWNWDPEHKAWREFPGNPEGWLMKLMGWLMTAFAVSLGAPFWFDLLNKFVVVRSTVKPHEKSPEEKTKA